jgi:hypothetical protein
MNTYRITYLAGALDISKCPPAIVSVIFPAFNGEPVTLCEQYCDVTFSEPQTPVSISPLIKVELLQE